MRVNARTEAVQQVSGQRYLKTQEKRVEKRGDSKEGEPSENEAAIGFIRCPSDTERAWGYSNNRQFENIQFKTAGKRKKKTVQERKCNYKPWHSFKVHSYCHNNVNIFMNF